MSSSLNFACQNGDIMCNGERVRIKGTNWFGLETDTFSLHGLWVVSFDSVLAFVKANKFNALRIPVSVELVEKMADIKPGSFDAKLNPDFVGITVEKSIHMILDKFAEAGILVMLDMHLLKASAGIPDLWYDADFPEQRLINAWVKLIQTFQNHWNFFAVDLKNEPHGRATWGDGSNTDWRAAAERIGKAVQEVCPRLLVFVEGNDGHGAEISWWGGYLVGVRKAPVRLPAADKLVYSPHVYGPDVHAQTWFKASSFPNNMPAIWDRHFGFIKREKLGPAVVPGEWGGKCVEGTPDVIWQKAIAEYFRANDMTDFFYWCVNPNSGDTGGLLDDDWKTPKTLKLQIIEAVCPLPTSFLNMQPQTPKGELPPLPWKEVLDPKAALVTGYTPASDDAAADAAPAFDPKLFSFTVRKTGSWEADGATFVQVDVDLKNNSKLLAAEDFRVKVVGGLETMQGLWTLDVVTPGVYKLPEWMITNGGGLQPGQSVTFGCSYKGATAPTFEAASA